MKWQLLNHWKLFGTLIFYRIIWKKCRYLKILNFIKENSNGKLMEFENQLRFKVDSKKISQKIYQSVEILQVED